MTVYRCARPVVLVAYIAADSPEEAEKAMKLLPLDELDQDEVCEWSVQADDLFAGQYDPVNTLESSRVADFTADYIFNKFGDGTASEDDWEEAGND